MKIRVEEAIVARAGIRSILSFEYHKTRAGVRSGPMLKLIKLDRVLKQVEEDFNEGIKQLIIKYGEEKVKGKPETSFIDKDKPERHIFAEERSELLKAEVEVEDSLQVTLAELKIRDENGELIDMENGGIANLGPLLKVE